MDKDALERLIDSTQLFDIDRETNPAKYAVEERKLISWLYQLWVGMNPKYEEDGLEIVEIAKNCINNFDGTGKFIHYFNAAMAKHSNRGRLQSSDFTEKNFGLLKISEGEKRKFYKLQKYLECQTDLNDYENGAINSEKYIKAAEHLGLSVEKIESLMELKNAKPVSNEITDEEGNKQSVFDTIAIEDNDFTKLENEEGVIDLFRRIQSAFDGLQDRQKNIMSDLITVRLADVLMDIQVPTSEYTFINQDILRQILSGKVVNQQAIAEKYGRKEASVSRALNDFIRKLQEL